MSVLIETTVGNMVVDLYTTVRPRTCLNFLKLVKIKYYKFSLLYNIKRDFCCQMGKSWDKKQKDNSFFINIYGKAAARFESEKGKAPRIKHSRKGLISMVVDKKGFHACQFLLTLGDDERQLSYLDQCGHSPFGELTLPESFETLEQINQALVDEDSRPYDDIRIKRIHVLHDPFPDPVDQYPQITRCLSPEPTKALLQDYRLPKLVVGFDEEDNLSDIDEEYEEKRDANQRAAILEMVGDLPHKDVTPDDNVLFVCKLNPVTQDTDLEIIFSRFGEIKSCDIIRDRKTGDSLQYAFIEFENVDDCEKAYLKMDNVLIDERRIHVDFSQSVAKQWLRWKNEKNGIKLDNTSQYLEDLKESEDPTWKQKKVTYTNKWAQQSAVKTEYRNKHRSSDTESLSSSRSGYKKRKYE